MEVGFLPYPVASVEASAQLTKTVAASGTPEPISATTLLVRQATIIAKKGPQTANSGIVHVGPESANGTQPYDLDPGAMTQLLDYRGAHIDLSQWYVDVETNGDGVVVVYDK